MWGRVLVSNLHLGEDVPQDSKREIESGLGQPNAKTPTPPHQDSPREKDSKKRVTIERSEGRGER